MIYKMALHVFLRKNRNNLLMLLLLLHYYHLELGKDRHLFLDLHFVLEREYQKIVLLMGLEVLTLFIYD